MVLDAVNREALAPSSLSAEPIALMDARAVRHLLSGGSVVDWRDLAFERPEQIRRFLDILGYDTNNPREMKRFAAIKERALRYVASTFEVRIPESLSEVSDPITLFVLASQRPSPEQRAACVVLKVMHVINHLDARRLATVLSYSEKALYEATAQRFDGVIAAMRAEGIQIRGYERNEKTESSLITKLMSKPRVTAAQIFDKLRFRVVVETRQDLPLVLTWLVRHVFPFSQVIPAESHNTILTEGELGSMLAPAGSPPGSGLSTQEHSDNPFTARSFHMIGFVIDLPIRLSSLTDVVLEPPGGVGPGLGHLISVTLELQLFDWATHTANQRGEASHEAYKGRQQAIVARRLWGGEPGWKA